MLRSIFACLAVAVCLVSCTPSAQPGSNTNSGGSASSAGEKLDGSISIDGSSTVYPLSQAIAEEFQKEHPDVVVEVARSGTGGGFRRFAVGEIDISDASRPINDKEKATCAEHGIEYTELEIAIDGITIVVNKNNDWCSEITQEQLKALWEPDSKIARWRELDESWPDEPIKLYGADSESGTFDFFTEAIMGKAKSVRNDYTPSADDNQLVLGVENDKFALGYIPYTYYVDAKEKLKVVKVRATGGESAIEPTDETVLSGTYTPLSRKLFLYVSKKALARPEVQAYLRFYIEQSPTIFPEIHSIPAPEEARRQALARLNG